MASFCAQKCSLISINVYSTYNSSYLAIVEEMFHVNSSSNNAKCLKFYRRKVYNSLQEIATLAIIWEISDSNLETTRYSLKSGVSWIIWESWQHCNDYVNLSLIYLSLLKLQWHAKVCEETFHVSGNLRSGVLLPFLLGDKGKRMPDRLTLHIVCAALVQNLDFCLIGRKTKDPFLQSSAPIGQATYLTSGAIRYVLSPMSLHDRNHEIIKGFF